MRPARPRHQGRGIRVCGVTAKKGMGTKFQKRALAHWMRWRMLLGGLPMASLTSMSSSTRQCRGDRSLDVKPEWIDGDGRNLDDFVGRL